MIVDFRVTPPRHEWEKPEELSPEGAMKRALQATGRGYARVYGGGSYAEYRGEKLADKLMEREQRGRQRTVEGMLKDMDEAGVDKAIIQAEQSPGDYRAHNEAVCRIANAHPDRLPVWFMTLDPHSSDNMVEALEEGVKKGCRGINLQPWAIRVECTDSRYWPVYAKCQELGLIVTTHSSISFNVDRALNYSHPSHLDKIACDFPNLTLIANHGGWPWVLEMIAVAWKHENVYIETGGVAPKYFATPGSGWEPLMQYGNSILQDQVLMATDNVVPFKRVVDEMKALPLKDAVKEKWLGGNAARILGLK